MSTNEQPHKEVNLLPATPATDRRARPYAFGNGAYALVDEENPEQSWIGIREPVNLRAFR